MADTLDKKKTPRVLPRMVFRRWRRFLLGASLFGIAVMLGGQFFPLKYTAETRFERRSDSAAEENAPGRSDSLESRKLTLQHELIGFDAVAKAAEDEGLMRGLAHGPDGQLTPQGVIARQELVNRLIRTLKVTWDVRCEQADLVTVSFTHSDPILAERMPNRLVGNYILRIGQQTVNRLSKSQDFLKKKVEECTARLDGKDGLTNKRLEFETRHAGQFPDNPGVLQQRVRDLTKDIDTLQFQNKRDRDTLARLKAIAQPTTGPSSQPVQVVRGPNPDLKVLQEELRQTREGLDTALAVNRMTENHPTVKTLRKKIEQLEARIKDTPAEVVIHSVYGTTPGTSDAALQVQIEALESQIGATDKELPRLQARLSEYQGVLENYAPTRQEYLQLIEKQKDAEAERAGWQQRLSGVEMALTAEIDNRGTRLEAVQLAQKQSKPSFPSLLVVLGLAVGGGLAFAAGMVLLMQMLDRSISTTEQAVRHFELPIQGVIEEIVTARLRARRRAKRWIVGPVVSFVVVAALTVSALNITIYLEYPDRYAEWRRSPVEFVIQRVANPQPAPKGR
jgi:uncharacterized protein involved in exopolysaccharide biosynthesis